MKTEPVALAETDEEILACHAVMRELRPQIEASQFVLRIRLQEKEGYKLAFVSHASQVVCVAGFRLGTNLAWGHFLYVDDLVTQGEFRSSGYGALLLRWLHDHARSNGCDELHLDSGLQRSGAHRFYEREGMEHTSHHYRMLLRRA